MSRLADALRAAGIHNNWNLLEKHGGDECVCVDYHRADRGRIGWGDYDHSRVWSPRSLRQLDKPRKYGVRGTERAFLGNRSKTLGPALDWASETFDCEFVPSPFGGYIPRQVRERAVEAARDPPVAQPRASRRILRDA